MWEELVRLDQELFRYINGLWIGHFSGFWLFVTKIENWLTLFLFFFVLIYRSLRKPYNLLGILSIFLVAASTLGLTNLVKNSIARLRPNNEPVLMDSIYIHLRPENFSFWSGHSAVSFAISTFVILLLKTENLQFRKPNFYFSNWFYLIYIWPFTFAISRIMVGVHYPADVVVGMIVGLVLGYAFAKAFFKVASTLPHTT